MLRAYILWWWRKGKKINKGHPEGVVIVSDDRTVRPRIGHLSRRPLVKEEEEEASNQQQRKKWTNRKDYGDDNNNMLTFFWQRDRDDDNNGSSKRNWKSRPEGGNFFELVNNILRHRRRRRVRTRKILSTTSFFFFLSLFLSEFLIIIQDDGTSAGRVGTQRREERDSGPAAGILHARSNIKQKPAGGSVDEVRPMRRINISLVLHQSALLDRLLDHKGCCWTIMQLKATPGPTYLVRIYNQTSIQMNSLDLWHVTRLHADGVGWRTRYYSHSYSDTFPRLPRRTLVLYPIRTRHRQDSIFHLLGKFFRNFSFPRADF